MQSILNSETVGSSELHIRTLPTPGEAKAKAMPGRLYIHTRNNNNKNK